MPKPKLGELIDLLYEAQQRRLEKQREYEAEINDLKQAEDKLEEKILSEFSDAEISKAGGKLCTASSGLFVAPQVRDWAKFYAYIKKNNAFELLEKRPAKNACRERWEIGVKIPGVDQFTEKRLYLNKINKDK